nr:translation initiation factor IF-5A [Candidatus Sigynarchaeota archaeon]
MSVTRKDANQLKKGHYFLLDGEVHRVITEPLHSKSGKHGHAKMRVDSENIFTGKKTSSTFPADTSLEIPNIEKRTAQITHVEGEVIGLMDSESFESFDTTMPPEEELRTKIVADSNVEYWIIMDKKKIVRVM